MSSKVDAVVSVLKIVVSLSSVVAPEEISKIPLVIVVSVTTSSVIVDGVSVSVSLIVEVDVLSSGATVDCSVVSSVVEVCDSVSKKVVKNSVVVRNTWVVGTREVDVEDGVVVGSAVVEGRTYEQSRVESFNIRHSQN